MLLLQIVLGEHAFYSHNFLFHSRGSDTLLGETSDPAEVFLVDECDNNPLGSIVQKCTVCELLNETVNVK